MAGTADESRSRIKLCILDGDRRIKPPIHIGLAGILGLLSGLSSVPSNALAQTNVAGNVLTSSQFPPVVMEFDEDLEYVGSSKFVLYGVADAEIHLFADVTAERGIERLYWVQFEGYLPTEDRSYDYSSSEGRVEIEGFEYYEDAWIWNLNTTDIRRGSDTEQVLELIAERDLTLGPQLIGVRLVRLDTERRNELMIVYLEDLAASGLSHDASSGSNWDGVREAVRDRALGGFHIEERAVGE